LDIRILLQKERRLDAVALLQPQPSLGRPKVSTKKQRAPTAGKYTPADNLKPCYDYGLILHPGPKKTILIVRIADFRSPKVLIGAMDFWN
jgi:hypothetical protein